MNRHLVNPTSRCRSVWTRSAALFAFASSAFALLSISGCSAGEPKVDAPLDPADSATGDTTSAGETGAPPDGGIQIDGSLPDAEAGPTQPSEVWAHSSDTLYKLDPDSKAVTVIGPFSGCSGVVDIALDENSNLYASAGGIFKIDKTTAKCTSVGGGSFAGNSLSFVPVGVLDPVKEVMVTYNGGQYMRVDIGSGTTTNLGNLPDGYGSSGDIVSVKGGGTYLSAYGPGCTNDCLLQVDPKTGTMIKNWGQLGSGGVWGLAFWAGSVYAFDSGGRIWQVTFGKDTITTKEIPIKDRPAGLSFWGAGSTTTAPLKPPT